MRVRLLKRDTIIYWPSDSLDLEDDWSHSIGAA